MACMVAPRQGSHVSQLSLISNLYYVTSWLFLGTKVRLIYPIFTRNRSGLACKNHIDCGTGVIDVDYRADIGVILFNHDTEPLEVKLHDRVAQLILERHMFGEELKEVDATERGLPDMGALDSAVR
jgi:deoxyuridine 5'-triphosphate nucleotidohydrolase